MPEGHEFLRNLALVLCVAAVTTVVFQRLRQPVVFGYLLAGMIVGPHIPVPLVADQAMVRTLAELGVILLMFSIGLEFSMRRLFQVGGPAGLAAIAETSVMMGLGYVTGRMLGFTAMESVFIGAIIAISSTTIIAKAFTEHGVRGRVGELVFGILIVEDIIAILLIATLTAAGRGGGLSPGEITATALRLGAFLAGLIGIGLLVVPRLIRAVVRLGRTETILVSSVGICFAASLLALSMGYSVALGAFIAGSLIAESGEGKAVERLVSPVRDLFVAIFFVAVGMILDPATLVEYWWAVGVLVVVVLAGKVLAVSSGLFLIGEGLRPAVQAGMSLAQIGEFSFIIAAVGVSTGATRDALYGVAIAVSAITTLSTPYLIRSAPRIAALVDARLPARLQTFAALYGSWIERLRASPGGAGGRSRIRRLVRVLLIDTVLLAVIVIALSVELGELARWLSEAVGLAPARARSVIVTAAVVLAAPLLLGLVRSTQLLGKAIAVRALPTPERKGVDLAAAPRRALEVTLQFALLFAAVALIVAVTQPFAPRIPGIIVVFVAGAVLLAAVWRTAKNLQGHAVAGAEVIAAALARRLADEGTMKRMDDALERVHSILPGLGEPVAMRVEEGCQAANRTLADLDLRGLTGATVLAVLRGDARTVSPRGDMELRPGDIIAVAGTHDAVDSVRDVMTTHHDPADHPPGQ
ncbi:MAG TPA: cation:proton antiporter [Gemmatimonadaceae bacterium]